MNEINVPGSIGKNKEVGRGNNYLYCDIIYFLWAQFLWIHDIDYIHWDVTSWTRVGWFTESLVREILILTRHVFVKHGCPGGNKVIIWQKSLSPTF